MRRTLAAAAALLCLVAAGPAAATPTKLTGNRPAWAASAQRLNNTHASQQIDIQVFLPWRNASALDSFATAVSNPRSAQYRQYLTPDQFRARFSPAQSDVDTVSGWLKSQGLQVTGGPKNRKWITARGTVAEVSQAFGTMIGNYKYRGDVYRAPDSEPSAPAAVAPLIAAVTGLENADVSAPQAAPPAAFVNAPPCSTYWGQHVANPGDADYVPQAFGSEPPYAPCGYTPNQLQGAYGVAGPIASGTNGANQTVAIVDAYAAGTIEDDANQYSSKHGLPPVNLSQIWAVPNLDNKSGDDGSHCGGPAGWYGEETLDVEAGHAMAPAANILYSGGQNCLDPALVSAVVRVLDDGSAHIVSNSYGDTGEGTTAKEAAIENEVYKQAAAEGIGLYFSAGDDGDESTTIGRVEADFPATIPWVTAVGGTSLAVGSSDNYLFETGWGTGKSTLTSGAWDPAPPGAFLYGSGRGTSKLFSQPDYQPGLVPTALSGTPAMRVIPDIAADGDPNTGMLVGETQT